MLWLISCNSNDGFDRSSAGNFWSAMLRITIENNQITKCFIIEGRLEGAYVIELEKCWQTIINTEPNCPLLVNLTYLTFIDASGKQLLTRMHRGGAKLLACGVMTRKIVEEIKVAER